MNKAKTAFQILGSVTGCTALVIQFYLSISASNLFELTYFQSAIKYFSFMTILTNIIVTFVYLIPLISSGSKCGLYFERSFVQSGVLVYILIVGIIYHALLAHIWNPQVLQLFADILLHTVMPVLFLIYWVFFTIKGQQKFINCIKWLCYPLVYIIYILIRGQISKMYPYPFVDVSKFGFDVVLKNIIYITIGYIVMGLVIIFFDGILFKLFRKEK